MILFLLFPLIFADHYAQQSIGESGVVSFVLCKPETEDEFPALCRRFELVYEIFHVFPSMILIDHLIVGIIQHCKVFFLLFSTFSVFEYFIVDVPAVPGSDLLKLVVHLVYDLLIFFIIDAEFLAGIVLCH